MAVKTCRGACRRELSLDAFSKDPSKTGGYRNVCRTCDAEARRNRRGDLPKDRVEAKRRAYKMIDGIDEPAEPAHETEQVQGGVDAGRWPGLAAFDREYEDSAEGRRVAVRLEKEAREIAARERRRASDFEALKPEDPVEDDDEWATGVANRQRQDRVSAEAARERRQEFNESMAEFATDLRDAAAAAHEFGSVGEGMDERHAAYIKLLAEQERRFGNRRWARSIAIAEAHEQLSREAMVYVAETYFKDKVEPVGYARLPRPEQSARRTACVLLSDLHLGSELDSLDEPYPFRAVEEARRLEFVLRQFVEFKPQYRDVTDALVILNGDLIDGMLLHDLRSGAPLTEQKAIFWQYFTRFISHVAATYKSARIVCLPGNHGRDKLRHPGRATASRWDSHEWSMMYALQMMCSELKNLEWIIPFRSVGIVDVQGSTLGVAHADAEPKLGDPDTKAKDNFASLSKINSTRIYGTEFDGWVFGHYHKGRLIPGDPSQLWNGPLVPPNGHARSSGYIGEICGQWIWESVEGHLFGDARFIEVGPSQDRDERLGTLIRPFRFSMHE